MNNERNILPIIRFREFEGTVHTEYAKHLFKTYSDKGYPDLPVLSASQELGMIERDNIGISISHNKSNEITYKRVLPGQFVVHLRSFQGGFAHSNIEGITSPAYTVFGFKEVNENDQYYWKYLFTSRNFIKRLETVTYGIRDGRSISFEEFLQMNFPVLSVIEQQKIADFFENYDTVLSLHRSKLSKLKALKQTMLSKIFPRLGEKQPEIRIGDFRGDWEERKLADYLEVSYDKNSLGKYDKFNVLSVSGDYGVVNQIEHQGRSFAGASVLGYGILRPGEVVYTKSPLKANPYGIIKTNQHDTGIVSVLYGVYKAKSEMDTRVIQNYFEINSRLNDYLRPLVNKGAKNTLIVSDEGALEGLVILPPTVSEQTAIADYFASLDENIKLEQTTLDRLEKIKTSLLSKMLV